MTMYDHALASRPVASRGTARRDSVVATSLHNMVPAVLAGAAIIGIDSLFSSSAAVHQWILVAYSVALWVLVPAIAAAGVVVGVSAHRRTSITPLHSALIFGIAAVLWMMLGVSNVEGSLYGIVLGAGAIIASTVFGRRDHRRQATAAAAVVVAVGAMMLNVAVPLLSPPVESLLLGLGLPVA
ncbi:hypothetical protein [Ruania rhizosphaerae]|uniref:hypothetical protein n=1 Tax=Ruania rhizosphaerae TaxID=1840413 RepID=UPI00135BBB04|nr:hypothetical protein [Ruania rhizosphaerae]